MPNIKQTQTPKDTESRSSSSSRVRVLSSKDAVGEASFRVYYGATGAAVPFMWESQPGTPKHPIFDKSNDNIVPPLTPPPSYISNSSSRKTMCRKSWNFSTLFSSSSRKSTSHVTPTWSMSSSSSSSYSEHNISWSVSSTGSSVSSPNQGGRKKLMYHKRSASSLCFSGHKSLLLADDDVAGSRSPPCSTMCFGVN